MIDRRSGWMTLPLRLAAITTGATLGKSAIIRPMAMAMTVDRMTGQPQAVTLGEFRP